MATSRAQPLAPDDRRATLLAAARRSFARLGYHPCAVSDIIDEAGVARGTFYNHFPSKRAVFQAVLEDLVAELGQAVVPIDVAAPIDVQLRANLARLVHTAASPEVTRLLFAGAVGLDDEGDELLRGFYGAATGRIARALELGQRLGLVRPGNLPRMAECLLGLVKEPLLQASLRGEAVDEPALVDELFALIGAGVLARA